MDGLDLRMVSNPKGEPFVQEARVGPAAQPSEVTWDGRKVTTGYLMMMMVYNHRTISDHIYFFFLALPVIL